MHQPNKSEYENEILVKNTQLQLRIVVFVLRTSRLNLNYKFYLSIESIGRRIKTSEIVT